MQSGPERDVHIPCCVPSREAFTIPLIPLGLKETKDVDFSVVLKVNLKALGTNWVFKREVQELRVLCKWL